MAVSEKYQKWVNWRKKQYPEGDIPMLTGSQMEIAEYIVNNEELCNMLQGPGDKLTVVESIQRYLKDK